MQNELLDYAIQEDIVEIKIAYRINKLFYSILSINIVLIRSKIEGKKNYK